MFYVLYFPDSTDTEKTALHPWGCHMSLCVTVSLAWATTDWIQAKKKRKKKTLRGEAFPGRVAFALAVQCTPS